MSLTIKQAFEALSDACANGMKNPFFVMRRLKESFADVASKVVDASGDKVTVTPITDSGTKIAEIKVNNTTSNLYAPSALHNYSTTEHVVGKWIDESDLYEITVEVTSVSSNDWTDVYNLTGADIKGYDTRASYAEMANGERVALDWYASSSNYNRTIITNSGAKFRVETIGSTYTKIVATIQYTKTAA